MSYPTYDFTFAQYSEAIKGTAQYPLVGSNMIYPAMGVCGEAGELLDKIKKHWRNKTKEEDERFKDIPTTEIALDNMSAKSLTTEEKTEIVKEIGDVIWYLNALCLELGTALEEAARLNRDKLLDRQARGMICSRGDNR